MHGVSETRMPMQEKAGFEPYMEGGIGPKKDNEKKIGKRLGEKNSSSRKGAQNTQKGVQLVQCFKKGGGTRSFQKTVTWGEWGSGQGKMPAVCRGVNYGTRSGRGEGYLGVLG